MDIGSVLRPDAYRLLLTNVLPGSVALAPWAFCVVAPSLLDAGSWTGGAGVVLGMGLAVAVLTAGAILEDAGSRLEVSYIDAVLAADDGPCPGLERRWKSYLALRVNDEVVGQRYLRNFLVRYKFELSMVPALVSCIVGLLVAACLGTGFDWPRTGGLVVFAAVGACFLWHEAREGGKALHELRGLIIRAAKQRPREPS